MARGPWTAIVLAAALGAGALAISSPLDPESAFAQARPDVIPGSYIVVYKDSVTEVGRRTRAREDELGFDRDLLYRHALKGFSAELTPEQLDELRADPKVALVSPNHRVEAAASEPLAPSEPTPPAGIRRILSATETTVRQAGANVAVIDSGVQLDHPDLNVEAGIDCVDPATPPEDDATGHGTHVAGTIGAKNNGMGVTGVAPNTKVYAVKVLQGGFGSIASVICGIDWVTANHEEEGIEVANMSLGGPTSVDPDTETCESATDPERIAICNSTDAGVHYVVAAGNEGRAIDGPFKTVPDTYPEVLTVTAISDADGMGGGVGQVSAACNVAIPDDTPASFSNWAATAGHAAHTIAAPGVCINSTFPGSTYRIMSGTSMATPHVAGAVALCVEEAGLPGPCADETPAETIMHMRDSANAYTALRPSHGFAGDPDHSPNPDRHYGHLVHTLEVIPVTNTNDSGAGSLRAAIIAANGTVWHETIVFASSLTGTVNLQSALPTLTGEVAIDGPGADRVTVRRSGAAGPFGIFEIAIGATVEISGLTIANGEAFLGGGVYSPGKLTLREVEVRDNSGGGVVNDTGELTVLRSTIADNDFASGDPGAGGIMSVGGPMVIRDSTIAGNEVIDGTPDPNAGGVLTGALGTTTITNSTVAGNTDASGGANLAGEATTLKSTIVANPLGGGANCSETVTSQGFNLESTDTCGLTQTTDLTDANPQIGALADNGGPTRTLLPPASSPAIDSGLAGPGNKDQRGETRTIDLPSVANAAGGDGTDIGAVELRPTLPQVTNTNDSGAGSLREAITAANAMAGLDAITFAPSLTGTVNLQSALPTLTGEVEIDGPGLAQLTVRRDAGGDYRIFNIPTGASAEISGLTITNGASDNGGGVQSSGRLLLERVAVTSNTATSRGGGVLNLRGWLTVKASTLAGNTANFGGGGLQGFEGHETLVLDSTISGNQSTSGGAGIDDFRSGFRMRTSTVAGNTASAEAHPVESAGGIFTRSDSSSHKSALIADSTIAGNTNLASATANLADQDIFFPLSATVKSTIIADPLGGGPNCDGPVGSQGFNLESTDTCGFTAPSDQTNEDPQLGPLADNGGPTQTMALPITSPAVDAGASTSGPNDQRELPRTVDQLGTPNSPGGNGADIGAFELGVIPLHSVTNTNDAGPGSLRAAITAANVNADVGLILFNPGLTGSIELQSALPALTGSVVIEGPAADRVTVERSATAGPFGIFVTDIGTTVEISGLTIAEGEPGVYNTQGTLTLREVEVRANSFSGVFNEEGDLTVLRSTIADNDHSTPDNTAAGILNAGGTMAIRESTIAGNEVHAGAGASSAGGVATFGGTTTITNSTIAGNTNPGGGANLAGATTTLKSTIVANPLGGGANCSDTVSSHGFNLESTDTCGLTEATDLTDTNPDLGALGDNGGPTRTLLPPASSPAIDRGLAGPGNKDQRGETRTIDLPSVADAAGDDATDIGAVELSVAELHSAPLQVTNTNDSGAGSLRAAITDANGLSGPDVITFAPAVTGTVNLQSALPALEDVIEIDGPGLAQLTVRRDAGGNYGIFWIINGAVAEISGLTITNGLIVTSNPFDRGAGVRNEGQLLLERVAVSSNSAVEGGGGVWNQGALTLRASTISGNSAKYGGGVADAGGTALTVLDSTISGNSATGGGAGIYVQDTDLTMRTSTVSGNTTGAGGDPEGAGGVWVYNATGLIVDSTIAGNTHLGGSTANLAAFSDATDVANVKSTIVANPLGGGPNCSSDPAGVISSQGFNLESTDTCSFNLPSDKTSQNPQLGPLADNGGPDEDHGAAAHKSGRGRRPLDERPERPARPRANR